MGSEPEQVCCSPHEAARAPSQQRLTGDRVTRRTSGLWPQVGLKAIGQIRRTVRRSVMLSGSLGTQAERGFCSARRNRQVGCCHPDGCASRCMSRSPNAGNPKGKKTKAEMQRHGGGRRQRCRQGRFPCVPAVWCRPTGVFMEDAAFHAARQIRARVSQGVKATGALRQVKWGYLSLQNGRQSHPKQVSVVLIAQLKEKIQLYMKYFP